MELAKSWAAALDDYVIALAWSPDGARLAAASSSGPISLFAAGDGARLHQLPGHSPGTNALAWSPPTSNLVPPASVLASAGQDGAVKFWDAEAGQHTATAVLGADWVEHLAWGPPGGSEGAPAPLAAASGRKLALLRPDGSVGPALADLPKTVSALAWHGGRLAFAFFGGVRIVAARDLDLYRSYDYANAIHALAWSPDGRWLVSGNQDPSVHLWMPGEDAELQMSGYETKVKHLSFDATSRWLATAGGRDACVWDCSGPGPEGREPAMFPHEGPVSAVVFQRSHGLLATGSQAGEVQVWSPDRRQPRRAAGRLPGAVTALAWSPDDAMLALGTDQGAVHVLTCRA